MDHVSKTGMTNPSRQLCKALDRWPCLCVTEVKCWRLRVSSTLVRHQKHHIKQERGLDSRRGGHVQEAFLGSSASFSAGF